MKSIKIKLTQALFILSVLVSSHFATATQPSCALPYLFFDLGANTLIDTDTFDFKKIFYVPGAYDYLHDLKAKGYHLGLLVNVPESWGKTQEEKLKATQKVIGDAWTDSHSLDWDLFDLGVAFPPTDADRKPAPFLFNQAMNQAKAADCDAVYQSTLPDEIPAANKAGMQGIELKSVSYDGGYYYPESRLRNRDYSIVKP